MDKHTNVAEHDFRPKVVDQPESLSKRFIETVRYVERLTPSGVAIPNTYHDSGKSGHKNLKLKVYPDSKVWYFQKKHHGKPIRTKIGDALSIPIQIARDQCSEYITSLETGVNPKDQKKARGVTLQDLYDKKVKLKKYADNTRRDFDTCMRLYLKGWTHKVWKDITITDIAALYRTMKEKHGVARSNMCIKFLHSLGAIAIDEDVCSKNPCRRLTLDRVNPKMRIIPKQFLRTFLLAVRELKHKTNMNGRFLEFALITGCRRDEGLTLQWENVDFENRLLTFPQTKNGDARTLPLSKRMMELLRELEGLNPQYVFPSRQGSKTPHLVEPKNFLKGICKKIGIDHISPHDLRRTFATNLAFLGCGDSTIKALKGEKGADVLNLHYVQQDKDKLKMWLDRHYEYCMGEHYA